MDKLDSVQTCSSVHKGQAYGCQAHETGDWKHTKWRHGVTNTTNPLAHCRKHLQWWTPSIWNPLTFCDDGSSCPVVVNHLDISKMDIAKKDAIGSSCLLTVVKGQRYDILEKSRIFKRLHGWVEVIFIRKVDAFQDSPFRVEQITFIALTGKAILCQAAVCTGAGPPTAAQVEAQLLAASVTSGTGVGAFKAQHVFS